MQIISLDYEADSVGFDLLLHFLEIVSLVSSLKVLEDGLALVDEAQLCEEDIIIGEIICYEILPISSDEFDDLALVLDLVLLLDLHFQRAESLVLVQQHLLILIVEI